MTTITCKIPEKLAAQLAAEAKEQRTSKSDIVREALEQRVRRGRATRNVSAYDLAKDLAGSISGPADLLTNPKYMEDFGA